MYGTIELKLRFRRYRRSALLKTLQAEGEWLVPFLAGPPMCTEAPQFGTPDEAGQKSNASLSPFDHRGQAITPAVLSAAEVAFRLRGLEFGRARLAHSAQRLLTVTLRSLTRPSCSE